MTAKIVFLFLMCFYFLPGLELSAKHYYCDPESGSIDNDGTSDSPWGTLQEVLSSGKSFVGGDIIYLRTGYHGSVTVIGINNGNVTVKAEPGHTPTLKNLVVKIAARWTFSGLTISPEVVGEYTDYDGIINIKSSSYINIENCFIYNAKDISGWDASMILERFSKGIYCDAHDSEIRNNHILNTRYAITVAHNAISTLVRHNLIENISEDGIRCLANDMVAEYNVLQNWFGLDDAHDDGFQSWTAGDKASTAGTKYGMVIRGNTVIASLENNPFPPTFGTHGIGFFDGMFEDVLIENNLICTNMWHGIALYGAINCKIINNTVVKNPYQELPYVPWIRITTHKDGRLSHGNIIRNNLTTTMSNDDDIGVLDHNIVTTDYALHFIDWSEVNFHLIPTSSAIDAGTITDAPAKDLQKVKRTEPFDIGCYEYVSPDDTINTAVIEAQKDPELVNKETFIELYPNPMQEAQKLTIVFNAFGPNKEVEVKIFDLSGKVEYTNQVKLLSKNSAQKMHINPDLKQGIYLLKVAHGNYFHEEKFVVK